MANESALAQPKADIDHYADTLWLERGFSEHTLSAYRSDLVVFGAYGSLTLMQVSEDHIQ